MAENLRSIKIIASFKSSPALRYNLFCHAEASLKRGFSLRSGLQLQVVCPLNFYNTKRV